MRRLSCKRAPIACCITPRLFAIIRISRASVPRLRCIPSEFALHGLLLETSRPWLGYWRCFVSRAFPVFWAGIITRGLKCNATTVLCWERVTTITATATRRGSGLRVAASRARFFLCAGSCFLGTGPWSADTTPARQAPREGRASQERHAT